MGGRGFLELLEKTKSTCTCSDWKSGPLSSQPKLDADYTNPDVVIYCDGNDLVASSPFLICDSITVLASRDPKKETKVSESTRSNLAPLEHKPLCSV
jgi:hypothetical protein